MSTHLETESHVFPIGIIGLWRLCWRLQVTRWQQVTACLSKGQRVRYRESGGRKCVECVRPFQGDREWQPVATAFSRGGSLITNTLINTYCTVRDTRSVKSPLSAWFSHLWPVYTHVHTHLSFLSNNAFTVVLIESIVPWPRHNNLMYLHLPAGHHLGCGSRFAQRRFLQISF